MKLLDLFCGIGGAARGYQLAGFRVTGVDIRPQPHYIGEQFILGDALKYVSEHWFMYDIIHASPPCQHHSLAQRIQQRNHPDLIAETRLALQRTGLPWVIENVEGAPLVNPIELCGAMFGLRTYRHRLFESSKTLVAPAHPEHVWRQTKMGRPVREGEFIQVVGNFSGAQLAREVMEMPWATRDGLREAIPPAYTLWVGQQLKDKSTKEMK